MGELQKVYRRYVNFNPADERHRAAYWELRHTGKQHDELRFILEEKYGNVLAMMQTKIADHYSKPVPPDADAVRIRKQG